jgi:hypothetical protein
MKTVGFRREPELTEDASGKALAKWTFIPKGVYRFKSHEAMNKHQEDSLARGMGLLAAERSRDRTDHPSGDTTGMIRSSGMSTGVQG